MKRCDILILAGSIVFLCGFSDVGLSDIAAAIIRKDFAKAEVLAKDFIARHPPRERYNKALYYLALSQLNLERYPASRKNFLRLLKSSPESELRDKAYLGLIDAYYLQGQYVSALHQAEKLLHLNPDSDSLSLIYLKLGRANLKLSQWEKAQDYLQRVIDGFPQSLESHLARQLLEEKQYFAVQVGAFIDRERAANLVEELQARHGHYAYIVETVDHTQKKFYRVRVGQLSTLKEAEKLRTRLTKLGYPTRIYP